ncbi:MAG: cell envelope integrity EipB family protein [Magnetospirillum sp.]|nr:cell envelope integrity EipB family protein [Magnetospirillum sp.]
MKLGSGLAVSAIAVLLTALAVTGAWAGGITLAPHRAIYDMALASTKPGSGIVGANGTMSYEFADACDGWIVENRIAISYAYSEGGQAMTTTDFLTWESKDGLKYRFRLRDTRDGQITDEVEGTAELRGKGKGGVARYTRPEAMTIALPKGTLFPTEHTERLIAAARAGTRTFLRVVFDGSDTEGAYDVSALIGRPHIVEAKVSSPLIDSPSWPMRLAYFPVEGTESTPDFEMALDYHANGVAQNIVQSFKDFSLVGKLRSIEALPRHRC